MTDPVIWFLFGVAAYFNLPKALNAGSPPAQVVCAENVRTFLSLPFFLTCMSYRFKHSNVMARFSYLLMPAIVENEKTLGTSYDWSHAGDEWSESWGSAAAQ